ncbi:hypothetical protein OROGR_009676 [Orobanche gracilis]
MRPHAVVIPYPAQGHIAPVLKLAKLLHYKGFFITFVNTEFNHNRLVRAHGPKSVTCLNDFQFKTIPDGLPTSNSDATQDIPLLSQSMSENCLAPFSDLINSLNDSSSDSPNVSCIVSDGVMSFTLDAAEKLGIPEVVFFTTSACGFMGYLHYGELVARGYVPFKDESCFTNGYLDTEIDWIPGMKGIRLRDLPTFIRTSDPDDIMLNYNITQHKNASRAKAIIINTFDELEDEVLQAVRSKFENVYTIGPLQLLEKEIYKKKLNSGSIGSNLWKEDTSCLDWLNQKLENSVLYINFGSITPLSPVQMVEFAWGLANSNHQFLWIIRPDLMNGEGSVLPEGFVDVTEGRGLMVAWCPQEQVLGHEAVGGFLTHCGWNSTIETVSEGVPMVCWPFFAEQQTNCRYACVNWGIGVEIEGEVTRGKVEEMVRVMMEGGKGKEMREKALEWKEKARLAVKAGGSSYCNLEKLIDGTLLNNS